VKSSPAIANGVVYVGSWDNKVYAFGTPATAVQEFPSMITVAIALMIATAAMLLYKKSARARKKTSRRSEAATGPS
jgi:hypothetical protein